MFCNIKFFYAVENNFNKNILFSFSLKVEIFKKNFFVIMIELKYLSLMDF